MSEASTSRMNWTSGLGMTRIGVVEKRVFRAAKVVSASGVQRNGTLVDVSAFNGRTVELNPRMNLR